MTAANGLEARQLIERQHGAIDLLLTNVVIPSMGGPELAEPLRSHFPRMKVVFSSGYTNDAMFRGGLVKENIAFIQKPYSPVALAKKVRQVLDDN